MGKMGFTTSIGFPKRFQCLSAIEGVAGKTVNMLIGVPRDQLAAKSMSDLGTELAAKQKGRMALQSL